MCRIVMTTVHGLTLKERLFMAFAWIPKATVQAAIGPLALDHVHKMTNPPPEYEYRGKEILTLAVLAIIITAPLGAIWIALTGHRLLPRVSPEERKSISIAMQAKREGVALDPEAFQGLPSPPSVSSQLNMVAEEQKAIQNVHSTIM